jgi:hypothetical protein
MGVVTWHSRAVSCVGEISADFRPPHSFRRPHSFSSTAQISADGAVFDAAYMVPATERDVATKCLGDPGHASQPPQPCCGFSSKLAGPLPAETLCSFRTGHRVEVASAALREHKRRD